MPFNYTFSIRWTARSGSRRYTISNPNGFNIPQIPLCSFQRAGGDTMLSLNSAGFWGPFCFVLFVFKCWRGVVSRIRFLHGDQGSQHVYLRYPTPPLSGNRITIFTYYIYIWINTTAYSYIIDFADTDNISYCKPRLNDCGRRQHLLEFKKSHTTQADAT